MFGAWFGRNGITGTGRGFPIDMGLNDENAFWYGSRVAVSHNTAAPGSAPSTWSATSSGTRWTPTPPAASPCLSLPDPRAPLMLAEWV
jgi:hypothetical protein